jgi:succinylglutamate desuccinylase
MDTVGGRIVCGGTGMMDERVNHPVPEAVRALAAADFSGVAGRFSDAGFQVRQPARGILQISAGVPRLALLLSVGVHGDETAPIELLAQLLQELAQSPHALEVDLMVVVGNPEAIAAGRRFIDADLNRMFRPDRGDLAATAEAQRADVIMQATAAFFGAADAGKWHLDLHTAVRPSLYPTFAIVPDVNAEHDRQALVTWLGGAGVGAVILNRKLAGTFSAYTATRFGANGCTVELGQVGMLGTNDLSRFTPTRDALAALLRTGSTVPPMARSSDVFSVAQEIVKRSDAFSMTIDRTARNFTALEPGALIARDGDVEYRVGAATEYVVFPNPDVRVGHRAGLMVARHS